MSVLMMSRPARSFLALVLAAAFLVSPAPSNAQFDAFRQAVAESAARDTDLAAFYRARSFAPVWGGDDAAAIERRNALLTALTQAPAHGLPAARFDPDALVARLQAARTPFEQGRMEVELSRQLIGYARAVQSGLLAPRDVSNLIKREVPYVDRQQLLAGFIAARDPLDYIRGLAPRNPEYVRLMRAKMEYESTIAGGGWGPTVPAGNLRPGASGSAVVALRNRLMAMGWLDHTVTATYDDAISEAVSAFQVSVGIEPDGVVDSRTLAEINTPIEERLESIIVAMERDRWMNFERGERHVWVNLADFTAQLVDDDAVTFETRAIIGAGSPDRQSPEFSDVMEHMVINPTWYVPRSIVVNEYLPRLRSNPGAAGHLQIINSRGQVVGRNRSFSGFSASSFPYSMRQPPGPSNALGRVKFMFPNPYNIYLHDTPTRSLFSQSVRTFSHGCIRLNDPLEFAYRLLESQTGDPVGFFHARLNSGVETKVDLERQVPVHLVYRTAFTDVTGRMHYRDDVYGRDARIWSALASQGVAIPRVSG